MLPKAVSRLSRLCKKLGGRLTIVETAPEWDVLLKADHFCSSPFFHGNLGVDWNRKIVYIDRKHTMVGGIIHEMGHVFACQQAPDECKCEFDFMGWEIAVARQAGCYGTWSLHNGDYSVDNNHTTWASLKRSQRQNVANERLKRADELGLLFKGKPVSIR